MHHELDPNTQRAVYQARMDFLNRQAAKEGKRLLHIISSYDSVSTLILKPYATFEQHMTNNAQNFRITTKFIKTSRFPPSVGQTVPGEPWYSTAS